MAVKDALFSHDHANPIRRAIDDTGAHATARALAAGDDRIYPQEIEMADQGRSPECARGGFLQYGLPGNRFDLIHDIEFPPHPVEFFVVHGRPFRAVATKSPRRDVDSVQAGDMNDRNLNFTRLGEELLNVGQCVPAREPAASRPGFNRFDDRFRLVSEDPSI